MVLENGEVIEGVGQFRYLGDVLNGEGGSNMVSINRVRSGWKKFRELSGVLTNKKVALRLKGRVYAACVRSTMLYGSETWAANTEQVARLSRAEMKMVGCMCGVSLKERKTNTELRKSLGIKDIDEVMRQNKLRWMGHVLRKDKDDWIRRSMEIVIEGKRGVGRPRMTWVKAVESDMRVKGLMREDTVDRTKWRAMSWGAKDCI